NAVMNLAVRKVIANNVVHQHVVVMKLLTRVLRPDSLQNLLFVVLKALKCVLMFLVHHIAVLQVNVAMVSVVILYIVVTTGHYVAQAHAAAMSVAHSVKSVVKINVGNLTGVVTATHAHAKPNAVQTTVAVAMKPVAMVIFVLKLIIVVTMRQRSAALHAAMTSVVLSI
ncbi:MAG: hypothetical protein GY841_23835, partial [FCB group bacterium]|nr:hypothetical protein [FCB group bacterium]